MNTLSSSTILLLSYLYLTIFILVHSLINSSISFCFTQSNSLHLSMNIKACQYLFIWCHNHAWRNESLPVHFWLGDNWHLLYNEKEMRKNLGCSESLNSEIKKGKCYDYNYDHGGGSNALECDCLCTPSCSQFSAPWLFSVLSGTSHLHTYMFS